jgi:hypothetical protein
MMKHLFLVLPVFVATRSVPAVAQTDECTAAPQESNHVSGPHELEGWTLESSAPGSSYGNECFSLELVLARNGHVIRRRKAEPIIWKWIFWNDGKELAIEEGPLHFGRWCVLEDLKTGRTITT